MCDAPKVDDSLQRAQLEEARQARQREEQRQAAIREGMRAIDAIFGGGTYGTQRVPIGAEFDPSQTYYLADGSVFYEGGSLNPRNNNLWSSANKNSRGYFYDPLWYPMEGQDRPIIFTDPELQYQMTGIRPVDMSLAATHPNHPFYLIGRMFGVAPDSPPGTGLAGLMGEMLRANARSNNGSPTDPNKLFQQMVEAGRLYTGTTQTQGFNDDFYDARRDAYLSYYQPQLDDQFKKAQDALTFALARAGTLNSTLAADKQADLASQYDIQRGAILSQAANDVAQLQSRIANEKSALIAQLNATGDAERAANEALARTQQIFQEQPAYSPLGDIFAGFAAGIGNYYNAQQNRAVWDYYNSGGSGSSLGRGVYTVN